MQQHTQDRGQRDTEAGALCQRQHMPTFDDITLRDQRTAARLAEAEANGLGRERALRQCLMEGAAAVVHRLGIATDSQSIQEERCGVRLRIFNGGRVVIGILDTTGGGYAAGHVPYCYCEGGAYVFARLEERTQAMAAERCASATDRAELARRIHAAIARLYNEAEALRHDRAPPAAPVPVPTLEELEAAERRARVDFALSLPPAVRRSHRLERFDEAAVRAAMQRVTVLTDENADQLQYALDCGMAIHGTVHDMLRDAVIALLDCVAVTAYHERDVVAANETGGRMDIIFVLEDDVFAVDVSHTGYGTQQKSAKNAAYKGSTWRGLETRFFAITGRRDAGRGFIHNIVSFTSALAKAVCPANARPLRVLLRSELTRLFGECDDLKKQGTAQAPAAGCARLPPREATPPADSERSFHSLCSYLWALPDPLCDESPSPEETADSQKRLPSAAVVLRPPSGTPVDLSLCEEHAAQEDTASSDVVWYSFDSDSHWSGSSEDS